MTLSQLAIYAAEEDERRFRDGRELASREVFPQRELDEIFDSYRVEGRQQLQVLGFLTRYPHLIDILLDALPHITRVFGSVDTYLEVEDDPEGDFLELSGVHNQ